MTGRQEILKALIERDDWMRPSEIAEAILTQPGPYLPTLVSRGEIEARPSEHRKGACEYRALQDHGL